MNSLFEHLDDIKEQLEQIKVLTDNQATVLLSKVSTVEEENMFLDLIEEMSNNKEEIIKTITEKEKLFQSSYEKERKDLGDERSRAELKQKVEYILELKNAIVQSEQRNVLMMRNQGKRSKEKVKVVSNQAAVAAYKKQQIRT